MRFCKEFEDVLEYKYNIEYSDNYRNIAKDYRNIDTGDVITDNELIGICIIELSDKFIRIDTNMHDDGKTYWEICLVNNKAIASNPELLTALTNAINNFYRVKNAINNGYRVKNENN